MCTKALKISFDSVAHLACERFEQRSLTFGLKINIFPSPPHPPNPTESRPLVAFRHLFRQACASPTSGSDRYWCVRVGLVLQVASTTRARRRRRKKHSQSFMNERTTTASFHKIAINGSWCSTIFAGVRRAAHATVRLVLRKQT